MNQYLILVKHSLPEIVENIPAREWHLSEKGRLRAEQLAERLVSYHPQFLVSSTEPKAGETAEIVARNLQIPMHIVENLHEHDRSNTAYQSKAEFEEAVREFFANADQLVFGNETADDAHARFSNAVYSVLNGHKGETIVIVAHGTVISLFVSRITGISDFQLWSELGLPSLVVLDMGSNTLIAKENIS
jgi:broad specificity phosphatase PhoE